jgi:hypothetical protein
MVLVELQADVRVPGRLDDSDGQVHHVDPVTGDVDLIDVLDQDFDSAFGGELRGLPKIAQDRLLR